MPEKAAVLQTAERIPLGDRDFTLGQEGPKKQVLRCLREDSKNDPLDSNP